MKLLSCVIILIACHQVICSDENMTEALLRAQGELNHAQEFTESQFIRHRFMISEILKGLTKLSIDLYFDALSIVRTAADDTRQQMSMLPDNSCREDAIGRWNRQVNAYNYQLTYCLSESKRILQAEYDELNYFDKDGARVSNHTPNQSFNMMLQHDVVQAGPAFYKIVNNHLRDLLLRAGPWVAIMDELVELMHHHTEQAVFGITICTRVMTAQFLNLAETSLEGARRCS